MMDNFTTSNGWILHMEGLKLSQDSVYPVFFAFLFAYIFILVVNVGITLLIFTDKNLQQPMYLLFCNLSINDILGNVIMVPRLLVNILRPPSERIITYYECAAQAFVGHLFGTSSQTVLMIMAFDRYVAICNPLRYAVIMTNKMVIKLTVSAWGAGFVCVGILLGLTLRLSRCRAVIKNPICDNASLFKLSCESVLINNIYGLTFTVMLKTSFIGSLVVTYTKITVVCLLGKNKSLNKKALRTCSTQLTLAFVVLFSGFIAIILHRFPQYADYGKLCLILFHVVPAGLNPLIYGLQADIVKSLSKLFQNRATFLLS